MEAKRWPAAVGSRTAHPTAERRLSSDAERGIGGLLGGHPYRTLSRREREVLSLIALGKTDRQIADDLFISRITVSNHVVHILDKLDVPNRTAAAIAAMTSAAMIGYLELAVADDVR